MSQSINKIHSSNLFQPSYDEDIFLHNGDNWVKSNNSLYKIYDVNIEDLDISSMGWKNNDIVALYKSQTNHILYSEQFLAERNYNKDIKNPTLEQQLFWVRQNLSMNSKYALNLPILSTNTPLFDTKNDKGVVGKVEHSISQLVYNKHGRNLIFSCYVKKSVDQSTDNVALTLFSDTYNVGLSAIFNLSSLSYTTQGEDVSAGINYVENGDYYRIYIIGKFNFHSQIRCKFNILNQNNQFKYESTNTSEKYSIYAFGFQLEEMKDNQTPTAYMTTINKPITKKILHSLYYVMDNKLVEKKGTELRYFDGVTTRYEDGQHIIESSIPKYPSAGQGDIGIVSSIISFANDKIEENKSIIKYRNNNKDVNGKKITSDDISEAKQIEMLSDGVVKLGSLEDGSKDEDKYPLYSIYYDKKRKEYRFKLQKGFTTLDYSSMQKVYKSITRSLTYNQGFFETWSSKGKCTYKHGFNTGGCYNFWKLNHFKR